MICAVAPSTCSQLSTTSSIERTSSVSTMRSRSATPVRGETPRVSRNAAATASLVAHPAEVDEPRVPTLLPCELDGQARLPHAGRTREGDDPRAVDRAPVEPREVVVPADERVGRLRQVPGASARGGARRGHGDTPIGFERRDRQHRPGARNALQRVAAPLDELDAGARDQVADAGGHEHLTGLAERDQARRDRDAEPGDVVTPPLDLARRGPRRGWRCPARPGGPSPRARHGGHGPGRRTPRARRHRWT